jgi:hypothetical protein
MIVNLEYNNKKISIEEYCNLMSKKILSILYKVDENINGEIGYEDLKKYIFNIAGNVSRLPANLEGG